MDPEARRVLCSCCTSPRRRWNRGIGGLPAPRHVFVVCERFDSCIVAGENMLHPLVFEKKMFCSTVAKITTSSRLLKALFIVDHDAVLVVQLPAFDVPVLQPKLGSARSAERQCRCLKEKSIGQWKLVRSQSKECVFSSLRSKFLKQMMHLNRGQSTVYLSFSGIRLWQCVQWYLSHCSLCFWMSSRAKYTPRADNLFSLPICMCPYARLFDPPPGVRSH